MRGESGMVMALVSVMIGAVTLASIAITATDDVVWIALVLAVAAVAGLIYVSWRMGESMQVSTKVFTRLIEVMHDDNMEAAKNLLRSDETTAENLRQVGEQTAMHLRQSTEATADSLRRSDQATAKSLRQSDERTAESLRQSDERAAANRERLHDETAQTLKQADKTLTRKVRPMDEPPLEESEESPPEEDEP